MKIALRIIVVIVGFLGHLLSAQSASRFFDDFNRPDSAIVGNAWIPSSNLNPLQVIDSKLSLSRSPLDSGAICRPYDFIADTFVEVTFTEMNGFGGIRSRFVHQFSLLSNGTIGNGYMIALYRGDANYPSIVEVWDSGAKVQEFFSTFPFVHAVHIKALFRTDGSIAATLSEGSNSFAFSIGARAIQSTGSYFAVAMSVPDTRTSQIVYPTADDVYIGNVENTCVDNSAELAALRAQLADANSQIGVITGQLADANSKLTAIAAQVDAFTNLLKTTFSDPSFQIPGSSFVEQNAALLQTLESLSKGQLRPIYRRLGGIN